MAKSTKKKTERLEGIIIGATFLLQKLYNQHHGQMSEGMRAQVREFLRDGNQVSNDVAGRVMRQNDAVAAEILRVANKQRTTQ